MVGADLLGLIWKSGSDLTDPLRLSGFLTDVSRAEAGALSQLLSHPMPQGSLDEARNALDALELKRVHNLLQRAQTQLKQPGLEASAIANLHQQVVVLRKEYLDLSARVQDIPPLPET